MYICKCVYGSPPDPQFQLPTVNYSLEADPPSDVPSESQ